ncbi:heme-binding protein [Subtercola boreus]|uniref:Heme-binding protein n=1 Tax=Subtercola boreus TaxID=120213 RepID=A0A3E0VUD9_9MICO|nr:heme-binding protein [Subtercola boreus]RFA12983.1 heme-binding protein [Subtercola boreus]
MTDQQPYTIVRDHGAFEVRRYPGHVLVEVETAGTFETAGNRAFGQLFSYLRGANQSRQTLAMTAPVLSSGLPTRIAMTAPIVHQAANAGPGATGMRLAFVLPEGFTPETAPHPTNPNVHLRAVAPCVAAALRFSGRWSTANYDQHLRRLRSALKTEGLTAVGEPRFAQFDPPFLPWFLRHNEVVLDIKA